MKNKIYRRIIVPKKETTIVTIRMPIKIKDKIEKQAEKEMRNVTNQIVYILTKYFETT